MNNQRGTTLIETLVAVTILAIILTGFLGSIAGLAYSQIKSRYRTQAIQLARESLEIAYNLSLESWSDFSALNGTYYLSEADDTPPFSNFKLTPNSQPEGIYTRTLTIHPANRDDQGNITDLPASPDPTTMEVTSVVEWPEGKQTSRIDLTTYIIQLNQP